MIEYIAFFVILDNLLTYINISHTKTLFPKMKSEDLEHNRIINFFGKNIGYGKALIIMTLIGISAWYLMTFIMSYKYSQENILFGMTGAYAVIFYFHISSYMKISKWSKEEKDKNSEDKTQ